MKRSSGQASPRGSARRIASVASTGARRLPADPPGDGNVLEGVRRLDRGLRLAAREVERATGLSAAQLFVLSHLAESPAASLSALAERTMTDRSSVSVVVERLVGAGLVERITAEGDRRRSEVRLTRAGRTRLRRAPASPTQRLLRAIARWPEREVSRLGELLRRLNRDLGFAQAGMLFEQDS